MSLTKLLTVGKSWMSPKNEPTRFKVTSARLIPTFKTEQQMPGVGTHSEEERAVPMARSAPPMENPVAAEPVVVQARTFVEMPLNAGAGAGEERNPFQAPTSRRREMAARPIRASIESVRVVRNDLSDSDLEVVTARPKASEFSRPAPVAEAKPRTKGFVWTDLTARLFAANRNRI